MGHTSRLVVAGLRRSLQEAQCPSKSFQTLHFVGEHCIHKNIRIHFWCVTESHESNWNIMDDELQRQRYLSILVQSSDTYLPRLLIVRKNRSFLFLRGLEKQRNELIILTYEMTNKQNIYSFITKPLWIMSADNCLCPFNEVAWFWQKTLDINNYFITYETTNKYRKVPIYGPCPNYRPYPYYSPV